jgi:hypothetical protein
MRQCLCVKCGAIYARWEVMEIHTGSQASFFLCMEDYAATFDSLGKPAGQDKPAVSPNN